MEYSQQEKEMDYQVTERQRTLKIGSSKNSSLPNEKKIVAK